MSLIIGTDNGETLDGGSGDDTIQGLGGDDRLIGGFDDDLLEGGAGNDTLDGGFDNDTLNGGDGNDLLQPIGGDATIDGGAGERDTLSMPGIIIAGSTGFLDLSTGIGSSGAGGSVANLIVANVEDVLATFFDDTVIGDGEANQLFGLAGNDSLAGGAGNDTLDGGPGNNTLDGGDGVDVLDYQQNAAPISVQPVVASAPPPDGGAPDPQENGLPTGLYVIVSGADTDNVASFEQILGTVEDDSIQGGDAADTFIGGGGNDTISGGGGSDNLQGGADNDTVAGGPGDDSVFGEAGDDSVDGGVGNDTVSGGPGNDSLTGGEGDDSLNGDPGDNTINGGAGNDTIFLSFAREFYTVTTIPGGFQIVSPESTDQVFDVEFVVFFNEAPVPIESLVRPPRVGIAALTPGDEGDEGETTSLNVTVSLDAPSDTAVTVTADTSDGTAQAGVDYQPVAGQTVTFNPGEVVKTFAILAFGNNFVEFAKSFSVQLSNAIGAELAPGASTGQGRIDNDDVAGLQVRIGPFGGTAFLTEGDIGEGEIGNNQDGFLNDAEVHFSGSRVLDNGLTVEQRVEIEGGETEGSLPFGMAQDGALEGTETFIIRVDGVFAPDGTPYAEGEHFTLDTRFLRFTVQDDDSGTPPVVDGLVINGLVAGLRFLTGSELNDDVEGTPQADTLAGNDGADDLDGGGGPDAFFGDVPGDANPVDNVMAPPPDFAPPQGADPPGANDDSIRGGEGDDTVFAGRGEDTVFGDGGGDVIIGQSGADTAFGGNGGDTLYGGADDDYLFGEDGGDALFGGPGADTLDGGAADDRLHVYADDDFANGNDGFDVLVVRDNAGGLVSIDLAQLDNQNRSGTGPVLYDFEAVDASLATAALSIVGAAFGGVGNALHGSAFDDTITGSSAADAILGQGGNDSLDGGGGDDTIVADAGNDTVSGGGGADQFFYPASAAAGAVRIADLAITDDVIVLPSSLAATPAAARALATQIGEDAVLAFVPGQSITLAGVAVASLSDANFAIA